MRLMLHPDLKKGFDNTFALLTIICSGMAANVVVFAGLAFLLAGKTAPLPAAGTLKTAFYLLGGALIGAALWLRRRFLSDEALRGLTEEGRLGAVRSGHIVLFALWEGLAGLGLVLSLLSADAGESWPFATAAALGMLLCWPRREAWEARLASLPGPIR